jgi:integrase
MASVSKDAKGNKRVIFVDTDGKRRAIHLGKMPQAAVLEIKTKVEHLVAAKTSRCPWNAPTAQWVADVDTWLADKLAAVGLIPRRESAESKRAKSHLGDFLKAYNAGREADAKPSTLINLRQAEGYLTQFFGAAKPIGDVTPGDADDYRRWLADKVGDNTARRHLGRAKQFFRAALRKRLISENPFADMKGLSVQANKTREFFVSREAAAKVLEACIDDEWRALFALARFGGLRTPSESLALTWNDIDWERGRIRVRSPKTEHHDGHGERIVPLFEELRSHLEALWDAAAPGTVYVVNRYRSAGQNLRTQLERIIRSAGLTPWPKLWQNLRASRATELAADFPAHVAAAWLGHSTVVAAKHYWQVTDDDFEKATRNPAQHAEVPIGTTRQSKPSTLGLPVNALLYASVPGNQCPLQDSNLEPAD